MACPIAYGDHKKKKKKDETTGWNIMSASATQGGHNKQLLKLN